MGYGIIMVSSEMPEVLGMSDRIVVMHDGRVTATLITREANEAIILKAAMQDSESRNSAGSQDPDESGAA
jgi:rhamnose transport system ATP-binding protein